jgi:aldehyde dehydrogenase (NAD+)
MTKLGEAILAHHEELAQLEARDCGKPMKEARADITSTVTVPADSRWSRY